MITESATALSRPPSVAVAPVRGITFTPCSLAKREDLGHAPVLRAMTMAAGSGHGVHVEDVLQLAEVVDAALDEDLLVGDHVV